VVVIQVFQQNVIAMVWDFDRTLIRGYMQEPLFADHNIDPGAFWKEVNALPARYEKQGLRVARESAYLNHILSYAWTGKFQGLSNEMLRGYGARLEFYDGMPDFMDQIAESIATDEEYRRHDITVEHYIVSTGLLQIIEGSAVRDTVKDIWASEFIEEPLEVGGHLRFAVDGNLPLGGSDKTITQVGYVIEDTTKTRALFEINKGVNVERSVDVNGVMAEGERRVPFTNMICIADGPSDVPMFSVVKRSGGKTFAVYDPRDTKHFEQVSLLAEQERVISSFPADYSHGSEAWLWLHRAATQIADSIVERREAALRKATGSGPAHVTQDPADPESGPASNGSAL